LHLKRLIIIEKNVESEITMNQAEKKPKCEFRLMKFGDKILSVERKTSCWTEAMGAEGNVEIKVDEKTGKKTAVCKVCGNTMTWGGTE